MKKSKIKKIDSDKFTKPDDIEDIEIVIGDTSILEISEVGDFINSVKPKPTDGSSGESIIIPREKITGKQKNKPKIANTANEIQIPKNVKKSTKPPKGPIHPGDSKVTDISSLKATEEPMPKKKKKKIDPNTGLPVKKKVKIDPFTGKPIKKKVKVDPDTGEPIKKKKKTDSIPADTVKKKSKTGSVSEEPVKKKVKLDPVTGKPIKKKVKIDPVTGKPIKKKKTE